MSNPISNLNEEKARRGAQTSFQGLANRGGGSDFGGMDPRVDLLDKRMDRIDTKLDRIEATLSDLQIQLAKMPTISGLWGMIATVLGIAIAMSGLAFMVAEWVKHSP